MMVVVTGLPPPSGCPAALSSWDGILSGATSFAKAGMQASAKVGIIAGNKHFRIVHLL
jgi:hypothetical protein